MESCSPIYVTGAQSSSRAVRLRVVVQPDNVQVKRVGRASIIEPGVKLAMECDEPKALFVNAYLRVQGSDNRSKNIPLLKSDEITFSKTHRSELVPMKLRFLKTLKVQMLKRNLGVSRPEGCIVFEAVDSNTNEVEAVTTSTDFAIISDPRYLDEVKKKRASSTPQKVGYYGDGDEDDDADETSKPRPKRKYSRIQDVYLPKLKLERDDPEYFPSAKRSSLSSISSYEASHLDDSQSSDESVQSSVSPSFSPAMFSDSSENTSPLPVPPQRPEYFSSCNNNLRCSQDSLCSDVADSDEEELRLAKLIQGLKKYHKHIVGCRPMPSAA